MQFAGLVQAMPRSSSANDPRTGGCSGVQRVPFHASATLVSNSPTWSSDEPTAMHAVRRVHDTAPNPAVLAPRGFGVGCAVHPVPFHRSASVAMKRVGELMARSPTVVQAGGAVQE